MMPKDSWSARDSVLPRPLRRQVAGAKPQQGHVQLLALRRFIPPAVATRRRAIQLPLAEGGVEALSSDPHRSDEHLGRATLEPMLAEDGDSTVERCVRIEFPWSCHKTQIAVQE
jgi:hypothetical protein